VSVSDLKHPEMNMHRICFFFSGFLQTGNYTDRADRRRFAPVYLFGTYFSQPHAIEIRANGRPIYSHLNLQQP
jgi:hypothetical protein